MSELEGIIRPCLEDLSQQRLDLTEQGEQSLAALEAYEQQLNAWHDEIDKQLTEITQQRTDLESQQQQLEEQRAELEKSRAELQEQQASEIATSAKLDQAQAEIEDLRQQLDSLSEPLSIPPSSSTDSSCAAAPQRGGTATVEAIDPTVSAVAKQFQKLRDQQMARRTAN